jgi:hypothetical protein
MKKELDEQLCREFPLLYVDRNASMQNTCMCWGFDVGDGWFKPIYELSQKLEKLIEKDIEENKNEEDYLHPRASQVKEKYGGLRFYMFSATEEMQKLIYETENLCSEICEDCGNTAKTTSVGGWFLTLCDKCNSK